MKKKNKTIDTNVCSSCGTKWEDHPGLILTCNKARRLEKAIIEIQDILLLAACKPQNPRLVSELLSVCEALEKKV